MPGTPDCRGKTLTPVTNWAGVTQSAHPRIRVISARPEPQTGGQSTTKGKLHPMKTTHSFRRDRSEEHTSELQSLMRISYAVFCLNKKTTRMLSTNSKTKETEYIKSANS